MRRATTTPSKHHSIINTANDEISIIGSPNSSSFLLASNNNSNVASTPNHSFKTKLLAIDHASPAAANHQGNHSSSSTTTSNTPFKQHLSLSRTKRIHKRRVKKAKQKRQDIIFALMGLFLFVILWWLHRLANISTSTITKTNNTIQDFKTANDNNNNIQRQAKQNINNNDAPMFQLTTNSAPICSDDNVGSMMDPNDISYTLVTQVSADRMWMLEHHCQRWGNEHLMSIAILTNQTKIAVETQLTDMNCDLSTMTIHVVNATLYSPTDYPINYLRNLAISTVTTTHFVFLDIDFWESSNLYEVLQMDSIRQKLAMDSKLAYVIPAFQLFRQCREWRECPENNIPKMPFTKPELLELMKQKRATKFDPTNKGGHGSTMYKTWITANNDNEEELTSDIPCLQSNRYEPFLVLRYCRHLPPFQNEFTGYGKNKMTWSMQLWRSGYVAKQLNTAFLIHYPHLDSKSRMAWNQGPEQKQDEKISMEKDAAGRVIKTPGRISAHNKNVTFTDFKRGRVDLLFVQFRKWLEQSIPESNRRLFQCEQAQDDDSRLWISHGSNNKEENT